MMRHAPVVLVTTRFFDDVAERWLQEEGFAVRRSRLAYDELDVELSERELRSLLDGAQAWIVATYPVTRSLLAAFPGLAIIARRGVGYNTIDTAAAAELGKYVTIAPGGNEHSVADHAVAMMLAAAKRLVEAHSRLSGGDWRALETGELHGKTVGLLGFGRIAQLVARRVRGFETKILASDLDPDVAAAEALDVQLVDTDTLLERSDFISLHVPLLDATRNIIDAAALRRMKQGSVLVNTSRGGLVDEVALYQALLSGQLAGAALDVFAAEEEPAARRHAEALLSLPNFVGTAHSAGSSREGLHRTNMAAARCVADVLHGKRPPQQCIVAEPLARALLPS